MPTLDKMLQADFVQRVKNCTPSELMNRLKGAMLGDPSIKKVPGNRKCFVRVFRRR